jgi:hypothetical protein
LGADPLDIHRKSSVNRARSKDVNELFVSELRAQYNMEFEIKKNLETKASSLISISGTVTALLFGFGTFFISRVDPIYDFYVYTLALLLISILSVTVSIMLSVFGSIIQKYLVVVDHKKFYKGKEFDDETWHKYCYSSKNKFNMAIAKNYFSCIKHNSTTNDKKARYVKFAQIVFFLGLAVLPLLLAIIISNFPNIVDTS